MGHRSPFSNDMAQLTLFFFLLHLGRIAKVVHKNSENKDGILVENYPGRWNIGGKLPRHM